jgi:anti-sigma-K factor RskA
MGTRPCRTAQTRAILRSIKTWRVIAAVFATFAVSAAIAVPLLTTGTSKPHARLVVINSGDKSPNNLIGLTYDPRSFPKIAACIRKRAVVTEDLALNVDGCFPAQLPR